MKLHQSKKRPDWDTVALESRNRWQRLAARTRGVITPGNAISLVGLCLTLTGLYLIAKTGLGLGLVIVLIGRLADVLDGFVADRTGTKSQLGKMIDASIDKITALATLIILAIYGLMPLWAVLVIGLQSIANIVLALIGRQRFKRMQPSRRGKIAVFGFWAAIVLFLAASWTGSTNRVLLQSISTDLANALTVGSLFIGIRATIGYFHTVFGRQSEHYAALSLFDRYVVVHNPASTDAHKTDERLRELRRLRRKSEIIVIETSADGKRANKHLLRQYADKLGKRTLLCIAAGDGTVNLVVDTLLHDPELPEEARETPILPLWCGNANDLAYMLNGQPTRSPIRKVLRRGEVVAIRPLESVLRRSDGSERTYTAACYASFGASAFATQEMERTLRTKSPIRRFVVSRFGQELIAVGWALMRAPTFRIIEGNKNKKIFERTLINGSRFAKIIGLPLRLTEAKFHRATIEQKHPIALLMHIVGLARSKDIAKRAITRDEFIIEDKTWAQFDGEAVHVRAGTEVSVYVGDKPFYALSTRLSRQL